MAAAMELAALALLCLGALRLATAALRLSKTLWRLFLRPGKDLTTYGSWALVTGASDGIGKAFCFELARRRINLILLGRSQSRLQELGKKLQEQHGISTRFVAVDFDDRDLEPGLAKIAQEMQGLDVGILINNAGVSYPYARFVHEVDPELLASLFRINIQATTRMTQLVLPGMLKRRKGAIVNIGSGSGSILPADPLYSLYAASKGYIEILSRSLHVEYKHSGIDVQCQAPLYVQTKLAKIRKASLTVPSPELYAMAATRAIGYEAVCTPFWAHHFIWCLISVVPTFVVDAVRLRSNLDIRRRGQLKDTKSKGN